MGCPTCRRVRERQGLLVTMLLGPASPTTGHPVRRGTRSVCHAEAVVALVAAEDHGADAGGDERADEDADLCVIVVDAAVAVGEFPDEQGTR